VQPERVRAAAEIFDMARRGVLQVIDAVPAAPLDERFVKEMGASWCALFQDARDRQGYLVDFLPLELDRTPMPCLPTARSSACPIC
jgi:hypothetical protein